MSVTTKIKAEYTDLCLVLLVERSEHHRRFQLEHHRWQTKNMMESEIISSRRFLEENSFRESSLEILKYWTVLHPSASFIIDITPPAPISLLSTSSSLFSVFLIWWVPSAWRSSYCLLHATVRRSPSCLWDDPVDILTGVFDVAGFTVDTVLGINLKSLTATRFQGYIFVDSWQRFKEK